MIIVHVLHRTCFYDVAKALERVHKP